MKRFWFLVLALGMGCGDDSDFPSDGEHRDAQAPRLDGGDSDREPGDGSIPPVDGARPGVDGGSSGLADGGTRPARNRLMYVSVGDEARLAVVELSAEGTMTARSELDLDLPNDPGPMAYAQTTRRLYIGVRPQHVATVQLDPDGRPSLLGQTSVGDFPVYLAVAQGDAVLVSAYFGANRLRTHAVGDTPPHNEVSSLGTDEEPHAARIGPDGNRVYVPHRNGATTHWYSVASDGTSSFSAELAAPGGLGPRHIDFSPTGAYAYLIYEYDDSIGAHRVAADGSLESFQTIDTLPAGVDGSSNTCADIHVTPDGRFVYGSNRGHDSLAMFAVGADGGLTSLGTVSTEARPREFSVSPDGRFVVVAGQDSGALQSYRIETDGRLTSLDRLDVGDNLLWVVID